jgi:hypothetical protein
LFIVFPPAKEITRTTVKIIPATVANYAFFQKGKRDLSPWALYNIPQQAGIKRGQREIAALKLQF